MDALALLRQVDAHVHAVPASAVEAPPAVDVVGDEDDVTRRSVLVNACVPDGHTTEIGGLSRCSGRHHTNQ